MKFTKKQIRRIIKEELGDPEAEGRLERARQVDLSRTARLKAPSSVEEVELIADLMANDPEFRILSPFVDKFKKYAQSGGAAMSSLEAALPEYIPGRLIASLATKAKEAMTGSETPIPQPKPAASAADMERWESDYLNEGKNLNLTTQKLAQIIKEQIAEVEQMTLNQSSVDAVLNMAKQIEPMFNAFRKSAGQSEVAASDPLYEQIEDILMELPYQLEEIAQKMKKGGI